MHFYVVHHTGAGKAWKVLRDDQVIGTADTQKEASDAAVAHAHAVSKAGQLAQVHVQGASGKFRTEWTYGEDPPEYPG